MKKIVRFLVIILTLMLLTPTVMGFDTQGWGIQPGGEGSTFTVSTNNYGLFCINHGYKFVANKPYRIYETGPLSNLNDGEGGWLLSFIIGDMQRAAQNGEKAQNGATINPAGTRNGQEWQEYIWKLIGTNAQQPNPAAYEELDAKYKEYKEVYNEKDNEITINFDSDVAVANAEGMIGPFKVNYPYKSRVDEHIDLKITMIDSTTGNEKILFEKTGKNTITNIITSDAERHDSF